MAGTLSQNVQNLTTTQAAELDALEVGQVSDNLTTPVIIGGLTASGSGANDFSASTGTFKTSSGANTLGGATSISGTLTVADATTPSITTASGKTNTGKLVVSGKTSGSLTVTTADATAQALTLTAAAQTVGAATITIPDVASVSDTVALLTKSQTFAGKTLTAPVINGATSASGNFDLSGSTGTFKTSTGAATLSGVTSMAATKSLTLAAGTATATQAPAYFTAGGVVLTAAEAGAIENDGVASYITNETTSGRGLVGVRQYFGLQANGGTVSTIANFFGATSNISLVSGGYYDIDIYCYFLNTTSGTVVWTFTNTAAPTSQNIYYESSPVTGVVAMPGTATMLVSQIVSDNTATKALTATSAITDGINMYTRFKIFLKNGTGTSLKIQATKSAGTITPLLGSYWTCMRLPATNVGAFAA